MVSAGAHYRVESLTVPNATIVSVSGEIDMAAKAALPAALSSAAAASNAVVVDLSGCSFMDSVGLHALMAAVRSAEQRGVAFSVVCVPDSAPLRLLQVTGSERLFTVWADRPAAIAAVDAA